MTWKSQGVCYQTYDPDFFPSYTYQRAAKELCLLCPVSTECLEYALAAFGQNSDYGIWGGTNPLERKQIRKARRARLHCL